MKIKELIEELNDYDLQTKFEIKLVVPEDRICAQTN